MFPRVKRFASRTTWRAGGEGPKRKEAQGNRRYRTEFTKFGANWHGNWRACTDRVESGPKRVSEELRHLVRFAEQQEKEAERGSRRQRKVLPIAERMDERFITFVTQVTKKTVMPLRVQRGGSRKGSVNAARGRCGYLAESQKFGA